MATRSVRPGKLKPSTVPKPEKLKLTAQQADQILASQMDAQVARERAQVVMDGVLAAAGISPGTAQLVSAQCKGDNPHVMIQRVTPVPEEKPES